MRFDHLPQNLGFTQHHGFQTSGHPAQMLCCVNIRVPINECLEIGTPDASQFRHEIDQRFAC